MICSRIKVSVFIFIFFTSSSAFALQYGFNTGNVIPSSKHYGSTFNIGLNATKSLLRFPNVRVAIVSEASLSTLNAETGASGVYFGYRSLSAGLATELGESVFFRPELGVELYQEYYSPDSAFIGENEIVNKGMSPYISVGFGIDYGEGSVGVVKMRQMGGKVKGIMWSYETSFY